ncbi:MAG: hypothetical protein ACI30J_06465 [Paludibacteraceae bacterium]
MNSLLSYGNVDECNSTLVLLYNIEECLKGGMFDGDKRVRVLSLLKQIRKEIAVAEAYWLANGGEVY